MPSNLPVLDKTWQHFHGVVLAGSSHQSRLLEFKNALIGFPLSPWIVKGSSNGTLFGNNDGVDHWQTTSDITTNSWIVLAQPGMGLTFQMILVATTSNASSMNRGVHPSGFGAAFGGTDGTATVAPLPNEGTGIFKSGGWIATSFNNNRTEIWMSTDGQVTRSTSMVAATSPTIEHGGIIEVELLKNPTPSAKLAGVPGAAYFRSSIISTGFAYNVVNDGTFDSWAIFDGTLPTEAFVSLSYQSTIGEISSMTGQNMTTPNGLESAWEFYPIWIRGNTAGREGIIGVRYDHWYGSSVNPHGTTFPAPPDTPGNQFIQFSDQIIPWDGTPSNIPF